MKRYVIKYTDPRSKEVYYSCSTDGYGGSYVLTSNIESANKRICYPRQARNLSKIFATTIFHDVYMQFGHYCRVPDWYRYSYDIVEVDSLPDDYFSFIHFLDHFYGVDACKTKVPKDFEVDTRSYTKYLRQLSDEERRRFVDYAQQHYEQKRKDVSKLKKIREYTEAYLTKLLEERTPGNSYLY